MQLGTTFFDSSMMQSDLDWQRANARADPKNVASLSRPAPERYLLRHTETGAVITDSELGARGELTWVGKNRPYATVAT